MTTLSVQQCTCCFLALYKVTTGSVYSHILAAPLALFQSTKSKTKQKNEYICVTHTVVHFSLLDLQSRDAIFLPLCVRWLYTWWQTKYYIEEEKKNQLLKVHLFGHQAKQLRERKRSVTNAICFCCRMIQLPNITPHSLILLQAFAAACKTCAEQGYKIVIKVTC